MKRIGDIYSVSVLQIKSLETQWFQGFFLCFYACFDPLFAFSRFFNGLARSVCAVPLHLRAGIQGKRRCVAPWAALYSLYIVSGFENCVRAAQIVKAGLRSFYLGGNALKAAKIS